MNSLTRNLGYLILGIVLAGEIHAQAAGGSAQAKQAPADQAPATKMEAFSPTAGSVVIFGYDELGRVGSISVDVRQLRDARAADVRGLVVEVTESQYRKERSFVDADEIPELLKGFDALLEVTTNPTQFKNFEVQYKTKGALQLVAFNDARGTLSYSVKAGRTLPASAFLNASDMEKLRALFVTALEKLNSLTRPSK